MGDCIVERDGGVMVIRFNRPDRMNSLGGTLLEELNAALDEGRTDDRVRAFIVTGEGRGWCAGADLQAQGSARPNENSKRWNALDPIGQVGRTIMNIHNCDKPIIAAVTGVAVGGGFGFCRRWTCGLRANRRASARCSSSGAWRRSAGSRYFLPRWWGRSARRSCSIRGMVIAARLELELFRGCGA